MRNQLVAVAAVLLVLNSCGDDTPERVLDPDFQSVDIVITLDWPMAREDGFVATRWVASSFFGWGMDSYEGEFDANGLALIEFTQRCMLGEPADASIYYEGHYTAAQPGSDVCFGETERDQFQCTSNPQTFVAPRPEGPACERPGS